ncbi:hypothetical protein OXX69_000328 [Metschnikowia pulcherrima]
MTDLIGVDIGSDSVRVSIRNGKTGKNLDLERPLGRTQNGHEHTMSGPALWAQIVSMLNEYDPQISSLYSRNELPGDKISLSADSELNKSNAADTWQENHGKNTHQSIASTKSEAITQPLKNRNPAFVCVAATCSMVVMRRVSHANAAYFEPIQPGHEVIVWMDTRARAEASWVSSRLPESALGQIGGTVTPEMGIAKLKWVDNHFQEPGSEICVFELYDWVTYVFLAGGYTASGKVKCIPGDVPRFPPGSMAMDGSVKGWAPEILEGLEITTKVCCTPNNFDAASVFPYVGTPLGNYNGLTVSHGCIDCYAGWAGQVYSNKTTLESRASSLLMVAGTSTCFIASVSPDHARAVPGLWGPFSQLLHLPVYSFGQPCTGQLFTELFKDYTEIVGDNAPFEFVEKHARDIEYRKGYSLPVLARHYLYYGDKHGNRSPCGDFRMGEILVDGKNAANADTMQCAIQERNIESLVLRYYLTIEFLVFQTKHLCETLAQSCGAIGEVFITGSQAQNVRFISMLVQFAFAGAPVKIRPNDNKYAGSQGIALSMAPYVEQDRQFVDKKQGMWVEPELMVAESRATAILQAKYRAYRQMAAWQQSFHGTMGEL